MGKNDSMFCDCLYYSANAMGRAMTRLAEEAFASTGLSPSHAFLLMSVNRFPGIQPGMISDQMMLTPSTVTRLIEKMEYKGLVERRNVGKRTEVHPTTDGRNLNFKVQKSWENLYRRYSSLLGEEKGKGLTNALYEAAKTLS